jgi:MOSC domain-containing protein YiiM
MHQHEDTPTLLSVQAGMPRTYQNNGEAWTTGFFKTPLAGSVYVDWLNIEGDEQADKEHHGGVDKAVLAYSADHYQVWEHELEVAMTLGGFGENLSIQRFDESSTCIGDRLRIGEAIFEVSQPRQPCWKLARRWNNRLLKKLVVQTGRSGWYLRVRQTGMISAGDAVVRLTRPQPEWTIARANAVFYRGTQALKDELARVSELSNDWKQELRGR